MTAPTRRPAHLSRGALVVPALLAALGLFLIYGTVTMDTVGDDDLFGPTVMPLAVAAVSLAVAVLLAIDILRPRPEYDTPAPAAEADAGTATGSPADAGPDAGPGAGSDAPPEGVNVVAVLTAVAGVIGFIVVLPWLGWILSATALFVAVAVALGNRNWVPVVLAGLALASVIQIAFSMLLGIPLPAGFVGGF